MKIIFAQQKDKIGRVFTALSAVLTAIGEDVLVWDDERKPVFDMLEESKPDFLFLHQHNITEPLIMALEDYPDIKTILYGVHLPNFMENAPPVAICCPAATPDKIMSNIEGVPVMRMDDAANIAQLNGGYYVDKMKSDVLYLSNLPVEKRNYIPGCINGILANTELSVKCTGVTPFPSAMFVGRVDIPQMLNFMASTKVAIDFDFDMFYDLVANRVFTITNMAQDLMPTFDTEVEMLELVNRYLNNEKMRRKMTKKAYKAVMDRDTYFHRVGKLADLIDYPKWKTSALEVLKRCRR